MKYYTLLLNVVILFFLYSCNSSEKNLIYEDPDMKIIFLHHSTGNLVWDGDLSTKDLQNQPSMSLVPRLLKEYNESKGMKISIEEQNFPKGNPYPWNNYPYDYYNIWVKNAGSQPYMEEPTLEMLSGEYDMIIFKHCFPVSSILEDDGQADVSAAKKTLANYKLQYEALKEKLLEFPDIKFLVWTGAALGKSQTNEAEALRAKEFAEWVLNEWDQEDDNIEIFDFRSIETEGGLYLKPEYAASPSDPHPNILISEKAARLFVDRIISVIEK